MHERRKKVGEEEAVDEPACGLRKVSVITKSYKPRIRQYLTSCAPQVSRALISDATGSWKLRSSFDYFICDETMSLMLLGR